MSQMSYDKIIHPKVAKVMYGDKRRTTFYEAYDRSDAIHKLQQDYGLDYVVRDPPELPF